MKLNYDCIRDLLLCLEDNLKYEVDLDFNKVKEKSIPLQKLYKLLCDYTDNEIFYSVIKLEEAGFISVHRYGDEAEHIRSVYDITYNGHQYLDTVRSPKMWESIKSTAKEKAVDLSFLAISAIAEKLMSKFLS